MNTWPNRGASGGPCGGWNNESLNSQKKSDHVGLTQANRPPRKSVRFNGKVRPRAKHLPAIAALRTLGKREATARVESLRDGR